MNRATWACLSLAALLTGCGAKSLEPENPDRALPGMGDVPPRQTTPWAPDAATLTGFDAGACCPVRFALLARAGETAARLEGDVAPFSDGEAMRLEADGGVWAVTVCVPEGTTATYSFETEAPGATAGVPWVSYRVNPNVPSTPGATQDLVNLFSFGAATSCSALDAAVYGDVSSSGADAGVTDAGGASDAGVTDAGTPSDAGAALRTYAKSTLAAACDTVTAGTTVASGATLDEELSGLTALPFAFQYFGAPVTHYAVSANGYLQLLATGDTPVQDRVNATIPSGAPPSAVVAPFWDDLYGFDATTEVRTQVFGTGTSRHLTVEWFNLGFLVDFDATMTFQVKVFEDQHLEFHYCTLSPNGSTSGFVFGGGATVGLEAPDGARGVLHSFNTAGLTSGSGLRFDDVAGP